MNDPARPTPSRRTIAWFAAILLQLGFLGSMIAMQERALASGARVVLEVAPVDPFDPLAGRYLAIRPTIGEIAFPQSPIVLPDGAAAKSRDDLQQLQGAEVAVELEPAGELHRVARVLAGSAREQAHSPFLAGVVTWISDDRVRIDYELDRWYIPGDAEDPTRLIDGKRHELRLAVRVTAAGKGAIEELLVDGQPYAEWNRAQKRSK